MEWCFNGQVLESGEKYKILKEQRSRKLIVQNSQLKDDGVYECREVGQPDNLSSCKLTVERATLQIIDDIQDLGVITGEEANFEITVSREVIAQWFHGTEKIEDCKTISKRAIVTETANDDKTATYKLKIISCKLPDSGIISLKVENTLVAQAVLDVADPPIHFTVPLSNVVVDVKKTAVFKCEVSDVAAVVGWYRNDDLISVEEMGMRQKFDVETCGTERKLTIKKCTKGDEASYTCLSPDNRRTTAELFIKMPVFKIEKDLENMEVMMGDAVKMVVKLSTERLKF